MTFLITQICSVDDFRQRKLTQKGIETKSIEAGQKVLTNTNTFFCKCIENTQYKYFSKVLKIQLVLMVKGLLIGQKQCEKFGILLLRSRSYDHIHAQELRTP